MNYLLLSLCFMLVGFPLVQASLWNLFGPKTCSDEVAKYLGEIAPDVEDSSVQKLIQQAVARCISFPELVAARYTKFHVNDELEFEQIGYPERCDKILKHFSDIGEKIECFGKEWMGTVDDYAEFVEHGRLRKVVTAGLLCHYVSKWRDGERDEFARLFDFNQNKRECISKTAAALSAVSLDESVEKVVKLTRDSDITYQHILLNGYWLTDDYRRALSEIDAEEGCNNIARQVTSNYAKVKCIEEEITGDTTALVELSAMDKAGDILLAVKACKYRRDGCYREAAGLLKRIHLDESVKKLVELSRELGLTQVHFEAAMSEPLDVEYNEKFLQSGYPESCDGIERRFSKMAEKCLMESVSDTEKQLEDVVLARWACRYASKLGLHPTSQKNSVPQTKRHFDTGNGVIFMSSK